MGAVKTYAQPDLVVQAQASVGEGPVWDHRTGMLCWVDIVEGRLFEDDLGRGVRRAWSLGTMVGAAAPREAAEGFAVAVADGFGIWADGELTIVDPILPEPHRRMNDAKCDSRGRLWAGSTHLQFVAGTGALHRWDGTAGSVPVASGFTLPNGMGWSPDDTTMYLVDSMTRQLHRADFHADEGTTGDFTPLCEVGPSLPDGLAVDVDGFLWIAMWGGGEVRRYSSAGELAGVVPMPVSQPSSCAFGDDGTLYITSSRAGIAPEELLNQPLAGSVFALATSTRGVTVRPFAG